MIFNSQDGFNSIFNRYHLDTDAINKVIDLAVANGQRSMGFCPAFYQGAPDGRFLQWADGVIDKTVFVNLMNLVKYARGAGINFFYVEPEFWGPHDFRQPPFAQNFDALWLNCRDAFWAIAEAFDAVKAEVLIDLCTELDAQGSAPQYATDLYAFWNDAIYPGVPCWNATMSIRPEEACVKTLAQCVQGKWPQIVALHPYINEIGPGLSYLRQIDQWLTAAGCPAGRSIVFGEADILQTDTTSQNALIDVRLYLEAGGRSLETVFQWPEYLSVTRPQLDAAAYRWR